MALVDDKTRIREALLGIPGVQRVLFAWPGDWFLLPTIAIVEASNIPWDSRDDREYITELEYYVRVFTTHASEIVEISSAVDDVMVELGYLRTMSSEDDSAEVRQKVMRYRIYL